MYQLPADLADQHVPLPPAGVRTLHNAAARDHHTAESQRKASQAQGSRAHNPRRSDRLKRSAALADARSADLAAEAR